MDAGDEDEKKHMENARAEIAQSTDYESPGPKSSWTDLAANSTVLSKDRPLTPSLPPPSLLVSPPPASRTETTIWRWRESAEEGKEPSVRCSRGGQRHLEAQFTTYGPCCRTHGGG